MSGTGKPTVREILEKEIVQRARHDAEFRALLLEKPKEALKQFGLRVPDHVEIKVVEETPNVCYIVLSPAAGK